MSGYVCAICGKTHHEVNEWRPCPLHDKKLICGTEHCKVCEYFRDEKDAGSLWCTYWHGRAKEESRERKIEKLCGQIRIVSNDIKSAYRRNYPKIARQRELDLMKLTAELRRIENE